MTDDPISLDPAILVQVAGSILLGQDPHLNRREVVDRAGLSLDEAKALWRALGFAEADDDLAAFTDADVEALCAVRALTEQHGLDAALLPALVRSMGSSFARLADWQSALLLDGATGSGLTLESLAEIAEIVGRLQTYIWRRHLLDATGRLLLHRAADDETRPMAVGFVDIVGYTTMSRRLSTTELATVIETFEQVTSELVVEAGGRVIKTIGDEVLYTLDDPLAAAEVALALTTAHEPEVRIGSAYGPVLPRLGDVFGPVVNIAARLTSIARPGRVLVDAELAGLLKGDPRFRLKRAPRAAVKGYDHLEPWSLQPATAPHP
ncbi:MAG: adenylate/guanylate cyclase domain-containing protein [Aeromicrobium sp.]|uniref:adenylate/guanylate cyclase domain-containing protein n=1 Tax=Aeromicrobium sp. TaxID=1871063 RepID=UPI0039E2CD38